jgi:hypothetical protein
LQPWLLRLWGRSLLCLWGWFHLSGRRGRCFRLRGFRFALVHSGEYRQRNIEKLREELAAEIFHVSQLRFGQQKLGLDDPKVVQMVEEAQARKIRIGLLVVTSSDRWKECFEVEEQLIKRIRGVGSRQVWSEEENAAFDREIARLISR